MALTDKLTAVADAIRDKTGKTEPLTLDQMPLEIAGIMAGAGGLAYDMGEFILDADSVRSGEIHHNLGESPDFILIWTDYFMDKGLSADNPNTEFSSATNVGALWMRGLTGLSQRITSTAATDNGLKAGMYLSADDYRTSLYVPSSTTYLTMSASEKTIGSIYLHSTQWWRAGIPYKYFVSKAWWNVGGVANAE